LTHNLTHTAKEADGVSGADRMENRIFLEQRGPETAEHQQFPGFQSVGKDEVGSSNLPSSSIETLEPEVNIPKGTRCETGVVGTAK